MSRNVPDTPLTLLRKLTGKDASEPQWRRFVSLYTPVIRAWLTFAGLPEADRDDALQDVLIKLVAKLRDCAYDDSRARFRTWLAAIVRNTAIDHLRKKQRLQERFLQQPVREMEHYPEESPLPEFQIETQFRLACMNAAIDALRQDPALTPLQREVLEHCIIQGRSPADLAGSTGFSAQHLYRTRKKLETLIRQRAELWDL